VSDAAEALRRGLPVVLPTDTVYGLCAIATREATERMYTLKGRPSQQPTALLAATIEQLLDAVPELDEGMLRALLPGPFTLVVPNPERRYPWLTGETPAAIGVRVPDLPPAASAAVAAAGPIVATSANLPGGPDPRRLDDVPQALRDGAAAVVDAGELPGVPSTVVDLTGAAPQVIREGAAPSAEVLSRLERA
jgi:L-threonylcarbamoyladenylate synthase